jgi:hypothetical protein
MQKSFGSNIIDLIPNMNGESRMAESSHSAIGPLNDAAQKEAIGLMNLILLDLVATVVLIYIVGVIANAIL